MDAVGIVMMRRREAGFPWARSQWVVAAIRATPGEDAMEQCGPDRREQQAARHPEPGVERCGARTSVTVSTVPSSSTPAVCATATVSARPTACRTPPLRLTR